MAVDIIEGITKEPGEIKFKGIDLGTNWLEEEEGVEYAYVHAYRATEETLREFDLSNLKYIEIKTYNESHDLVEGPVEWEMASSWDVVKFIVQGGEDVEEVTEDILVDTGSPYPNQWVQHDGEGKYRIGMTNTEDLEEIGNPGDRYHIITEFRTEAGRRELIHFPVDIIDVEGV